MIYFGKIADLIEMLFRVVGQVGQRNDVLDGVQFSSW